jgi:hypothetical protein
LLFKVNSVEGSERGWDVVGIGVEDRPRSKTAGEGDIIVVVKRRGRYVGAYGGTGREK